MKATLAAAFASLIVLAGPVGSVAADSAAPPVYPGAVAATRPAAVGLKTPPPQAKTYVTSDDFAKVKSWYQSHLTGAREVQQSGMEKTEDAFLLGSFESGTVVMIQSYEGKTWIVIGPTT